MLLLSQLDLLGIQSYHTVYAVHYIGAAADSMRAVVPSHSETAQQSGPLSPSATITPSFTSVFQTVILPWSRSCVSPRCYLYFWQFCHFCLRSARPDTELHRRVEPTLGHTRKQFPQIPSGTACTFAMFSCLILEQTSLYMYFAPAGLFTQIQIHTH